MKILNWLKQLTYSVSFRINMAVLLLMLTFCYTFCRSSIFFIRGFNNLTDCDKVTKKLCATIDSRVKSVEYIVNTAAHTTTYHRINPRSAGDFCANVAHDEYVDTIYILYNNSTVPAVNDCVDSVKMGKCKWSEPYMSSRSVPTVTFLAPLRDGHNNIYAMLCADMSLTWIGTTVVADRPTEHTEITIKSPGERYIYAKDSTQICQVVVPEQPDSCETDAESEAESGFVSGLMHLDEAKSSVNMRADYSRWNVECIIPVADTSDHAQVIYGIMLLFILIFFPIISIVMVIIIRRQLKPLHKIAKATKEVSKGNFSVEIPVVKSHTDIRNLRDNFVQMQDELSKYVENLRATTEAKASMERDLSIAAGIQQGMLPKNTDLTSKGIDIHGMLKPAKSVGGDLFDFMMRDDRLYFCIGDVSGKGVPAALFMTVVGHLFRHACRHTSDPVEIVSIVNDGITEGNEQNMFCTLFVGVLDITTGMLNFCNAGHNAPVIIHDGKPQFLDTQVNMPTGVLEGFDYALQHLQMSEGDSLFLYTDGVTEAENTTKELFGDPAVLDVLSTCHTQSMQQMSDTMLHAVQTFANGAEQSDDITILCLRYMR